MDSKRTRQGSTFLTAMEARGVQRKSPEEGGKACVHSINSFSYCCCFYLLFCLGMYKQNLEDLPPPPQGGRRLKVTKTRRKNEVQWTTNERKGRATGLKIQREGTGGGHVAEKPWHQPATSWRLTEEQVDAAQRCSAWRCGRMMEWMDTSPTVTRIPPPSFLLQVTWITDRDRAWKRLMRTSCNLEGPWLGSI